MTTTICTTDGFVLRSLRYGDTSRVATIFSHDLGKFSVIAKGARVPGSAFGSEGYIRLSFATAMANLENALARIAKALA